MRSGGWACRVPVPAASRRHRPSASAPEGPGVAAPHPEPVLAREPHPAAGRPGHQDPRAREVLAVVPQALRAGDQPLGGGGRPFSSQEARVGGGMSPSTRRAVSSRPASRPGRAQAQEHRLAVPAEPAPGAAVRGPEHPAFGNLQQPGLEPPGSEHEGHQEAVALDRVQAGRGDRRVEPVVAPFQAAPDDHFAVSLGAVQGQPLVPQVGGGRLPGRLETPAEGPGLLLVRILGALETRGPAIQQAVLGQGLETLHGQVHLGIRSRRPALPDGPGSLHQRQQQQHRRDEHAGEQVAFGNHRWLEPPRT